MRNSDSTKSPINFKGSIITDEALTKTSIKAEVDKKLEVAIPESRGKSEFVTPKTEAPLAQGDPAKTSKTQKSRGGLLGLFGIGVQH